MLHGGQLASGLDAIDGVQCFTQDPADGLRGYTLN